MSIAMAARKAGIELVRDVPIPGRRRTRDWAILIGTARKLEAQEVQEERDTHKRIEDLSMQVVELTRRCAELKHDLDHHRLKDRAREIEMSREDTRFLLTGSKGE